MPTKHVGLFVTPWTAAHQASLSITNSWSPPKPKSTESVMPSNHLILHRPLHLQNIKCRSLNCVWLFATPVTIESMEFSRPEYWSGLPFPSPGDLPNSGLEPRSPALQVDSSPTGPKGSPRILEWVAYTISSGSSQPRNRTGVSWIAGGFFTNWTIREA